jgi:soluble lytic murein transglycosylase
VLLHFAGEEALAFAFFSDLGRKLEGAATLGALARLGLDLDQPHYAVRVAKHAARKGILLYPAYYPVTGLAGYASKIEPALAMAIARQETELNQRAISPAGARGLMQLMPATAKKVAGWIGEPYSQSRLTDDWQYNARLGQTYLSRRIDEFGGSYVLAAAAYNAGASRVVSWIGEYGDPRLPGTDMIDWMESIPFSETRNYVQRVMEGLYVYRSRLAGQAGPMTIEADLARGVRN